MAFNDPPWHPISNPVDLKHLGKLGEETAELSRIVARIIIQGMDGIDPATGENNTVNLQKEMADVIANIELNVEHFCLDVDDRRITDKKRQLRIWHKEA